MKKWLSILENVFVYIAVIILCAWILFPPLWMVLNSFKTPFDTVAIPPKLFSNPPTIQPWLDLLAPGSRWEGPRIITHLLPNSITVAVVSTCITLILASLSAYSLSRFRFKGRKGIAFGILATRMLPPIATVTPLYLFASQWGLLDNLMLLIIIYTALNAPLAIWMLKSFVDEVPADLEEAAMVDGASRMYAFIRITFPLIAPGLVAVSIFSFLLAWNDFAIAFFLVSVKAKTLPLLATAFIAETEMFWGPMGAFVTISILPAVIFASVATRYMVRGLTLGAVKR